MTIDDKIRYEKILDETIRESAKILPRPSGKVDKYEYLTGEDILPSNQRQIIEQAKFMYSGLRKVFEKQTGKQVGVIKFTKSSNKKKMN